MERSRASCKLSSRTIKSLTCIAANRRSAVVHIFLVTGPFMTSDRVRKSAHCERQTPKVSASRRLSMAKLWSPLVARKKSPPLGLIRSWPGWFLLWLWLGACGRSRRR